MEKGPTAIIAQDPAPSVVAPSGLSGTTHGGGSGDRGNSSVVGAGGTTTPTRKRRKRPPGVEVITPTLRRDVAVLKASGMSTTGIAKTLGKHRRTINDTQILPDVKANIADLRRVWKQESQAQVTGIANKTWNLVEEFVDQKDSKQLDNTMRAVYAMEKVSASVSGEGQKVELSGPDGGPLQIDARAILAKITDYVGRHRP